MAERFKIVAEVPTPTPWPSEGQKEIAESHLRERGGGVTLGPQVVTGHVFVDADSWSEACLEGLRLILGALTSAHIKVEEGTSIRVTYS
jgi:hypothetical protein